MFKDMVEILRDWGSAILLTLITILVGVLFSYVLIEFIMYLFSIKV